MSQSPRTMFAGQAVALAEIFKYTVGKTTLDGSGASYRLELSAPEGESTAGGKQALQHVSLVRGDGAATLVMATANSKERQAEIRTYGYMTETYRRRFKGATFEIDKANYETVLQQVQKFFQEREYKISLAEIPQAPVPAAAPTRAPARPSATMPSSSMMEAPTTSTWSGWRLAVIVAITAALVAGVGIFLTRG